MKTPDINKVHGIRRYKLGTRYVEYINEVRHVYQYIKIDRGVVGTTSSDKVLRWIQYMWVECR